VYWSLPADWPQPFRQPIDITQDDAAVMQQIHDVTFGASER
jgi:hypothetical protein